MKEIRFLEIQEVLFVHKDQVNRFNGSHGIRDMGLLDSAINAPRSMFSNNFLYPDVFHMAAAYAYSLIKNHPFIDGNKRTGIVSATIFLEYNGFALTYNNEQFFDLGIDIATSKLSIEQIADILKNNSKKVKN